MSLKKTQLGVAFQKKAGSLLSSIPLSPNQISFLALFFALAGLLAAYLLLPLHSLALFILAGLADAIDGAIARLRNQATARGAYMDGIIDRLVEFLFILSFFFFIPAQLLAFAGTCLLAILFFGTCMTSFATAYAEHRGVADKKKIGAQPGVLPRAERLFILFAAFFLLIYSPLLSAVVLFAAAALSFITFVQRAAYFLS
ncbi:MAG: CDP-alcohol phosphatidyltransferase family protein [Candidatus Micrarchaeota archaeon]|nr:CDP-alcohol phosphatidyltransferase family protein [Candidatus Micrarchaeota archaeon]